MLLFLVKICCGLLKELQFVINFIPLFPDCFTTSIPTWADQISTKKQVRSLRVCACVCACMKLWSWLQPYVMATPWRPVTFFTFIDWSDPVALRWRWTFMCRPMTPTSHLTSISGPNFHSHSRQVLSLSLSLSCTCVCTAQSGHNPKHISESESGATAPQNPIWPVTWSLLLRYGGGGGGAKHTTVWESEHRVDTRVPGCCAYCLGSLRCCYAFRSSTTAGGWRPWSPTGCSSLPRCMTRTGPDTTPRHGARTQSESVCLQKMLFRKTQNMWL